MARPSLNTTSPETFTTSVLIGDIVKSPGYSNDVPPSLTRVNNIPVSAALEIQSTEGALLLPRLSATERDDANFVTTDGMVIFNTDDQEMNVYQNGAWATQGGASATAKYILQQANAGLPNAQSLGALATGILKSTTTTGVVSIATNGTDYYSPGHPTTIIDTGAVTSSLYLGTNTGASSSTAANSTAFGNNTLTAFNNLGIDTSAFGSDVLPIITDPLRVAAFGFDIFATATSCVDSIAIGSTAGTVVGNTGYDKVILIGGNSDTSINNVTNSVAIGFDARVSTDNSFCIGSDGTRGTHSLRVGIGTDSPGYNLHIATNDDGNGLLYIGNSVNPPATPSGGGVLFVQAGALKWIGSSGTITPLAPA